MNETSRRSSGPDEYGRQIAAEKAGRVTLARDLFALSMLFLVASGATYYYEYPIAAAALFMVFLMVQLVASETRLEIAMLDANRWLAALVEKQGREIRQLRDELRQEEFSRTR